MNNLFYIETFGCKLNQLDGERIREGLTAAGFTETHDPGLAAVIIVNACSVTGKAEKESRYRMRRAARHNPDARRYLVGCLPGDAVQPDPDTVILPADRKFDIPELGNALPDFPATQAHHVRPLIHIQNGCDLNCSYCIVPTFRGPSRSIPIPAVLRQLNTAISRNRGEVVLTGIHLGTWGRDLSPKQSLVDLLIAMEQYAAGRIRVRISSLDSNEIPDDLIEFFRFSKMIQPHFHVPLQHGSAGVLKRMRRRYNPDQYLERVQRLREALPDACIGADVIPGFPGETEAEFVECCHLIEESPLDYLHVFPFSPRPGTDAARMPDPVPEDRKRERVARLREWSDTRVRAFRKRFFGKVRPAVLVYPDQALTDNYIPVSIGHSHPESVGRAVLVKLNGFTQRDGVDGELVTDG